MPSSKTITPIDLPVAPDGASGAAAAAAATAAGAGAAKGSAGAGGGSGAAATTAAISAATTRFGCGRLGLRGGQRLGEVGECRRAARHTGGGACNSGRSPGRHLLRTLLPGRAGSATTWPPATSVMPTPGTTPPCSSYIAVRFGGSAPPALTEHDPSVPSRMRSTHVAASRPESFTSPRELDAARSMFPARITDRPSSVCDRTHSARPGVGVSAREEPSHAPRQRAARRRRGSPRRSPGTGRSARRPRASLPVAGTATSTMPGIRATTPSPVARRARCSSSFMGAPSVLGWVVAGSSAVWNIRTGLRRR